MLRAVIVVAVVGSLVAVAGARPWMVPAVVPEGSVAVVRKAGRVAVRRADEPERRWRSPAVGLAVVAGLVYANQVLFTVYVLREHGGDPSFVDRYVPDGWFTLARGPVVEWLAGQVPAPWLLAPSVFRVNAFLELPLVVLAYLTVCRWFSPEVYRRALRLVTPTAVAWSATFCLIEWRLYNPYTVDDVVLRIAAAVVVAVVVPRWVTTSSPGRDDGGALVGLSVWATSVAAFSALVLVVYDTALLYNLGHIDRQAPIALLGCLLLVAARSLAHRVGAEAPGAQVTRLTGWCGQLLVRGAGWLLVVGVVPALPIRYGLISGAPRVAAFGALVVSFAAGGLAFREMLAARPEGPIRVVAQQLAGMTAVGLGGAVTVLCLVDFDRTEARLLVAAVAAFGGVLAAATFFDRRTALRRPNQS